MYVLSWYPAEHTRAVARLHRTGVIRVELFILDTTTSHIQIVSLLRLHDHPTDPHISHMLVFAKERSLFFVIITDRLVLQASTILGLQNCLEIPDCLIDFLTIHSLLHFAVTEAVARANLEHERVLDHFLSPFFYNPLKRKLSDLSDR